MVFPWRMVYTHIHVAPRIPIVHQQVFTASIEGFSLEMQRKTEEISPPEHGPVREYFTFRKIPGIIQDDIRQLPVILPFGDFSRLFNPSVWKRMRADFLFQQIAGDAENLEYFICYCEFGLQEILVHQICKFFFRQVYWLFHKIYPENTLILPDKQIPGLSGLFFCQMTKIKKRIVVLGAGISGLATAFWLDRQGFEVTVLEAESVPGGSAQTNIRQGFLIDYGPNSGLETSPEIRRLVEAAGLSDEMIYAGEQAKKRYILKRGRLCALPTGPSAFIQTPLFSLAAKLRLLLEPFIPSSSDGYYQSIARFVKRRLGREFLDYAIDPFVSGVYAGDPYQLSVKSAFPKLYALEEKYGSLIKGAISGAKERKKRAETSKQSAKMFSFKSGMNALPAALAGKLGDKVRYNCKVERVVETTDGFSVAYVSGETPEKITADAVMSTVPAYVAAEVFANIDAGLSKHLNDIYYPPVMTLYLGYNRDDAPEQDGFGFLIPSRERKKFLGAIWNSALFPGRTPENAVSFTLFIGGSRNADLFMTDLEALEEQAIVEFQQIMKIKALPLIRDRRMWEKAIPQYNVGYVAHENYFVEFEEKHPGLFLRGNFRGGISFGDCIKNAREAAENIEMFTGNSALQA